MAARAESLPEPVVMPLQSGDRLTRVEFHRRYCQHPEIKKAELVEGVVYVASPVGLQHSTPDGLLQRWLGAYLGDRMDAVLAPNTTVVLDVDNEVQPDACLFYADGRSARRGDDGFLHGAPELIAEIAVSSASYDLHSKMNACRRNGVQEYIVWRVFDKAIDWFELVEGTYVRLEPDTRGVLQSKVFPGLKLAVQKMLDGDMKAVLQEARRGRKRS